MNIKGTKDFTMLQLFSIIDGRLSSDIDDVYDILNHVTGENLMTHHLPTAMDYLKKVNPNWYSEITSDLNFIKMELGDDFIKLMDYIKNNNPTYSIPQLTDSESEGFGEYMINNSLLLRLGSKA